MIPLITSRAQPLVFENAFKDDSVSSNKKNQELLAKVKQGSSKGNVRVTLRDILKTSDNSYFSNFLNHLRNFFKTACEYLFGGNVSEDFLKPNFVIKNNKELMGLGKRGTQVTNNILQQFLQSQETGDRKFILDDLADNTFKAESFNVFDKSKVVSIPVRVEGFRNKRSHIVNVKISKNNENYDIEFFDSRGYGLTHPTNKNALDVVQQFIQTNRPIGRITSSFKRIQTNGHDCGVFVAWHATDENPSPPKDMNQFRRHMVETLADRIQAPANYAAPMFDWDEKEPVDGLWLNTN